MKKVAIITGASRGIGAETAKLLAKKNFAVCINYHQSAPKANILVDQINKTGGKAIAVKADMASEDDIIDLFNTVDAQLGPVDVLINNAGSNGGICEVENISAATLTSVFATNVYSTFYSCREALKRMKGKGGAIVNVTSEAAKFGGTKLAHYAASKAALNTFTLAFAREAAQYQVRVNAVSPGVIDTDMHQSSSPERLSALMNSLPMKRMGKASEVANLIYWLVSEEASYVSGAVIPITGSR